MPASSGVAPELIRAVTALGDSVPAGTACGCTPYPEQAGADLGRVSGRAVQVWNDAEPGARSSDVVDQLEHDPTIMTSVARADAVLIEVGANDVEYSPACGTTVACYDAAVPGVERNLTTIVQLVDHLNAGRDVDVVLLDYWSAWLGGRYAQAKGTAYAAAADAVTARLDDAIRSVAQSTGAGYVDLRTAFRGTDRAQDETHLLAPDGDHPDAEGHARIAQAVASVIEAR